MPYLTTQKSLIAYNGYDVGLGNRVRVTLGAKSLAEFEGRKFYYVWPTGARFGPRMSDLWEYPRGARLSRVTSRLLARRWGYNDETLEWIDDQKREQRIWQVRTGTDLRLPDAARPWDAEFRDLRPVPRVARTIQEIYSDRLSARPYVGVMIRAHAVSHSKTRETSPVSWFISRMSQLRAEHPEIRFFVSCDVPEVQEVVEASVPGSWGQKNKGSYNTTEGVRSSVVDLYLLASAAHLIGPHYSSFPELAVRLSGGLLRLETPVKPVERVNLSDFGSVIDPLRPSVRL